jgi:hypothetical protein
MRAALSLTLILALVTSTVPVAAQESLDRSAGPITRTMMREAMRLAAESAATEAQEVRASANAGWSSVRRLAPGTEITLTVKNRVLGIRYVLSADDSMLMVLDLTSPSLLPDAKQRLQRLAEAHPHAFDNARAGAFVEADLFIDASGVFVNHQKVAELGEIVRRVPRSDVEAIETVTRTRSGHGRLGITVGSIGLGFVGGIVGGAVDPQCSRGFCNGGPTGALIGIVGGGFLGYFLARGHVVQRETVIYRAE